MTEILIIIIIILIKIVTILITIISERIRTSIIKTLTIIIIRIAVIWTAFHPEKVDRFVFICHYIGQYFYSIILKKIIAYGRDDTWCELAASKKNYRKLKNLPQFDKTP